jgi:hypothetical protein
MHISQIEEQLLSCVESGDLSIDDEGRVWRHRVRGGGWIKDIAPRRAEHLTDDGYFQVRVMLERRRYHAAAHRLVYRVKVGPIPAGLTINHINGLKTDNRPSNLEPATHKEQVAHVINVLGRKWGDDMKRAREFRWRRLPQPGS